MIKNLGQEAIKKKENILDEFPAKKNRINNSANKVNKKDIMEYFIFDENMKNIEENPNDKRRNNTIEDNSPQIKPNYKVCTFMSSPKRPDLYCPFGYISGNKYELKIFQEKSKEEEEKEAKKEEDDIIDVISVSSIDSFEEEKISITKKVRINRYFNIETDISLKCKNCGEIGHTRKYCLNIEPIICTRCTKAGHDDKKCDKKKCFKCNKLGHVTNKCPMEDKDLIICEQCNCIGHKNNECLIRPMEISHHFLLSNNLKCFYCGSSEHILCSLNDREFYILQKEEENNIIVENNEIYPVINLNEVNEDNDEQCNETIIKDNCKINEQNFIDTFFCGLCGDMHKKEDCINKDKFNNKFDDIRKNYGKQIIEKRKKEIDNTWLFTEYIKKTEDFSNTNNIRIISLDEDDSSENEYCFSTYDKGNTNSSNKDKKKYIILNQRKNKGKINFNKCNNNGNERNYLQQSFDEWNQINIDKTSFDWGQ